MEESKHLITSFQLEKYSRRRHLHDDDRISSLPDDVLLIILSFLTLKGMAKTSILSSRWLDLWVKTPVLDFHAPLPIGYLIHNVNYVEWVNNVLRRHRGHLLKEFKIGFYLNIDYQEEIDRWLEFALARKVKNLKLNFLLGGSSPCNTTFNYAFPDCFLKFCSSTTRSVQFDLKCLRSLSLKNVDVTGEAVGSFLLNCPFLERLEMVGNHKLVSLVISDPTLLLKYMEIKHCFGLKVLSISNLHLVSLDISSVKDLTLGDLPMLVELSIEGYSDKLNYSFSRAASCLSQLESLTLDASKLKEVTQLPNLAKLTKLKRLVIKVRAWGDESLTMLLYFMKSCHHLKEFVLELTQYTPERATDTSLSLKSRSLKVFEFRGYYGRVSDDELITRIVKNAPGLEKIIIETLTLMMHKQNIGVLTTAHEARSFALKKIEYLRESKRIPPHVNVLVP